MDSKLYEILMLLSEDDYMTSRHLAEKLSVSEKTVRTRIGQLSEILSEHGATVASKRHFGYRLNLFNVEQFNDFIASEQEQLPVTKEERQNYLLKYLLLADDFVKLDDLSEELFISRNSLSQDIKRVEDIVNRYQLSLIRRPNYGIRISGHEFSIRTCLTQYQLMTYNQARMQTLMAITIKENLRHTVHLTEVASEGIVKYVSLMLDRISLQKVIEDYLDEKVEISRSIRTIIDTYCQRLEDEFDVVINEFERYYLSLQYASRLASDSYSQYGQNFIISSRIDEMTTNMLSIVSEIIGINFQSNLELRMALNQHLVPMDIRMRYQLTANNPLLEEIKREYSFAFTLAKTACLYLNHFYGKEVPEDEVGYIAVIFALAVEKRHIRYEKKNIVLVCATGKSSSQLFKYKYEQAFGPYINSIFECTISDLEQFDFENHAIDYIFTTVPLPGKYPVPIYEINFLIGIDEIVTYTQMFQEGDQTFMLDYYSNNLFMTGINAETKEEVLKQMCDQISYYGLLPDGFYESVLEREQMGATDFGNYVAIPHPLKVMSQDTFVVVAILDRPILWTQNEVQVVFLISVGSKKDNKLEEFYQKTSSLLFDKEAIQLLLKKPTFETLVSLITK
ncbi:BglG family transcription antiterminator [Streptococcus merionis]|uniref:BglG family transcription antiterminator n=1 Tax=Streptococcus merionis TaxID=400065 RepID=UPI0035176C6B